LGINHPIHSDKLIGEGFQCNESLGLWDFWWRQVWQLLWHNHRRVEGDHREAEWEAVARRCRWSKRSTSIEIE
jgi:hypothetical protein